MRNQGSARRVRFGENGHLGGRSGAPAQALDCQRFPSAPPPFKKGYPRGHAPFAKYLTVPVFDQERIVAVVGLANKKADYDDMDVWQVALLMNNVWMMVERRRSDRALLGEKERLGATLLSVSEGVIATDRLGAD